MKNKRKQNLLIGVVTILLMSVLGLWLFPDLFWRDLRRTPTVTETQRVTTTATPTATVTQTATVTHTAIPTATPTATPTSTPPPIVQWSGDCIKREQKPTFETILLQYASENPSDWKVNVEDRITINLVCGSDGSIVDISMWIHLNYNTNGEVIVPPIPLGTGGNIYSIQENGPGMIDLLYFVYNDR